MVPVGANALVSVVVSTCDYSVSTIVYSGDAPQFGRHDQVWVRKGRIVFRSFDVGESLPYACMFKY